MAFAVGFGWLLWRYLPELGDMLEAASDVADDGDTRDPPLRGEGRSRSLASADTAEVDPPSDIR